MAEVREREGLLALAIESWRFSRVFVRMLAKLDAGDKSRFESQLRFFLKKLADNLEASGFRLVSIEEQAFDPGIAATALNAGDFDPADALVVDQMLEPIIMGPEGVVRPGTVLLRKAGP